MYSSSFLPSIDMTSVLTFLGQYSSVIFANLLEFAFIGAGLLVGGLLAAWVLQIISDVVDRFMQKFDWYRDDRADEATSTTTQYDVFRSIAPDGVSRPFQERQRTIKRYGFDGTIT